MASIASLKRLSAPALAKLVLEQQSTGLSSLAIIDVRDDDYIGGHIKGSTNYPSNSLDAMLPTMVRQFQDKDTVVFHCALSQQRGPSAALRYLRERERLLPTLGPARCFLEDGNAAVSSAVMKDANASASAYVQDGQKVYVLDRGFLGWQELHGEDVRLTEGYRKELWQDD